MGDPFEASVQYGDLRGEVALDGHSGPPLEEMRQLADVPPGHFVIGFHLYNLDPDDDGTIPISLATVRCDDVGTSMGQIMEYARAHGRIPIRCFEGRLPLRNFPSLFKRFDLKVLARDLGNYEVVVDD